MRPFCGLAVFEEMAGGHTIDDAFQPVVAGMSGHELKPAEADVVRAARSIAAPPVTACAEAFP